MRVSDALFTDRPRSLSCSVRSRTIFLPRAARFPGGHLVNPAWCLVKAPCGWREVRASVTGVTLNLPSLPTPRCYPELHTTVPTCAHLRPPGSWLLLAHSRLPAPQPGSRPYFLFPRDNRINHKTVSAARAHRAICLPACVYVRVGGPPSRPRGRRSERRPQPAVLLARVRTRLLPCSSLSFQPRIPPAGPSPRPPAAAGPRGRSGALGILSRSGSRAAGPLPFAPPGKPWSRAPGAAAASPAPRRWGPT